MREDKRGRKGVLSLLVGACVLLAASSWASAQEGKGGEGTGAEATGGEAKKVEIKTAPKGEPAEGEAKVEGDPKAEVKPGGEGATADPAAAGDAASVGAADASGSVDYDMRVRELEEKVNDLKEKIFRSKSRLVLLKETVLRGSLSGSKAVLIHQNEMGSSFELEHAVYSLDGNQIFNEQNADGELSDKERFEIFNGAIVPGNHNLSVMLIYRGNGFGVFNYLQGYKFTIRSSYTFTAEEGKTTQVSIIGYEKGGITTALEDRPDVKYELEFFQDADGPGSASNTTKQ